MKSIFLIWGTFLVIVVVGWVAWEHYPNLHMRGVAHAPRNHAPATPYSAMPHFPVANDWQKYHAAREKALQENPDLAAEYKELLGEVADQQAKVDAAMIKADPKVVPIIAKLAEIRKHNAPPPSAPASLPR